MLVGSQSPSFLAVGCERSTICMKGRVGQHVKCVERTSKR